MFDPIPDPISGKSILPWAVPVTRALNAIGDKVGASARNERDRRAANKPLPYEVRWDSSLNSGEGGYKIYLPTEHLLSYAGEDVATSDISGATVIQADNADTPWYSLDDIDTSADHVWLVVTVTESNGSVVSVDAEFSSEEGQSATGENVMNVCIAEVSYEAPENEGDTAVVAISQSVVGAVHLGGEGGGGEGGGGGSSTGANGTIYSFEGLYWDSSSYMIRAKFRPCTVTNGLITAIGNEATTTSDKSILTTPITSEVPY